MEIIACPETTCAAPAEIVDRWTLDSTDGPVEHVKTRCLARHIFTPRTETLAGASPPNAALARRSRRLS